MSKSKNGNGQQLAVQGQEPSVALMLQTMIDRGITSDNVAALEQMTALYERMEDRRAEKLFAESFNSLMSEIPQIKATKAVPNNDGTVRYRFAPLEEIDAQLRPLALKHGFSYFFSESESQPGRITKVCTIQHVAGHKRSTSFTVRTSAPPKASDTQADGSTHSYGKRGALCDAFGIIIEHMDDDARMIGKPIGKALAEDLRARVKATNSDEQVFLKYAGVACSNPAKIEDYEQISDSDYDRLDAALKRKESKENRVLSEDW